MIVKTIFILVYLSVYEDNNRVVLPNMKGESKQLVISVILEKDLPNHVIESSLNLNGGKQRINR